MEAFAHFHFDDFDVFLPMTQTAEKLRMFASIVKVRGAVGKCSLLCYMVKRRETAWKVQERTCYKTTRSLTFGEKSADKASIIIRSIEAAMELPASLAFD